MNTPMQMTLLQKKQAALLYHFASLDYLKGLQQRVNDLMAFIDPTLDLAKAQNRDSVLIDPRWGSRDTSANWGNNAWPFLADFQMSIAKDIANRAFEIYNRTGTYQCARGISEYSMQWTTPDEENKFNALFKRISSHANNIDDTMKKNQNNWDDFTFALAWQDFKGQFAQLPKFQIRADIEGETGKVPVRTGVYIPQDDPHGSLQFAWTGGGRGQLIESNTFNEMGLDALKAVGRRDLWLNEQAMFEFATSPKYESMLKSDIFFNSLPEVSLAPAAVSGQAFTTRPCKWYYVELVNGEFEDIDDNLIPGLPTPLRSKAGQPCPQSGLWQALDVNAQQRTLQQGEIMPDLRSAYGLTVWEYVDQR